MRGLLHTTANHHNSHEAQGGGADNLSIEEINTALDAATEALALVAHEFGKKLVESYRSVLAAFKDDSEIIKTMKGSRAEKMR